MSTIIKIDGASGEMVTLSVEIDRAYEHDHTEDGLCCWDDKVFDSTYLRVEEAEKLHKALGAAIEKAKKQMAQKRGALPRGRGDQRGSTPRRSITTIIKGGKRGH
jgi:hypothetical protein